MPGHYHEPGASSQNVGNHIGSRPCVRMSKLYRQYESGNNMKALMGMGESTKWDVNKMQGAYSGKAFDHNDDGSGKPPRRSGAPNLQTSRRRRGSDATDAENLNQKKSVQDILRTEGNRRGEENRFPREQQRVPAYGRRSGKSVTPPTAPEYDLNGRRVESNMETIPRGYERDDGNDAPSSNARVGASMYSQQSPARDSYSDEAEALKSEFERAEAAVLAKYAAKEAEVNARFENELDAKYESELREMASRALRDAPPVNDEEEQALNYRGKESASNARQQDGVVFESPAPVESSSQPAVGMHGRTKQMISISDDAMWEAVTTRDVDAVARYIAAGANVNSICPDGWTRDEHAGNGGRSLLHHAAWAGNLEIFKMLVDAGGEMLTRRKKNWAQPRGNTPFHAACFYGRGPIVQYCLEHGADVNMQGEQGHTPLHLAAMYGYHSIARMLLACGARTDMLTKNEKTPMSLAKDDEMKSLLIDHEKRNAGKGGQAPLRSLPEQAAAYGRGSEERDNYSRKPRAGKASTSGSTYANAGHGIIPDYNPVMGTRGVPQRDDASSYGGSVASGQNEGGRQRSVLVRRERPEITGKIGSGAHSVSTSAAPSRLSSSHGLSPHPSNVQPNRNSEVFHAEPLPSTVQSAVNATKTGLAYAPGQKGTGVMSTRPW